MTATTVLKAVVGTYAAATPVALCNAGEVKLTVRNWVNTNAAAAYALSYNCLVLSKTGTTAISKDLTTTTAVDVAAAVVTDKFATSDLAGAGT